LWDGADAASPKYRLRPIIRHREPREKSGVYRDVFEQSILLDHNANRQWNFLASLSAELVVVSLALLIPLAFSDHLPAIHWKDIMMSPPPAPLQEAVVTPPHSGSTNAPTPAPAVRPMFHVDRGFSTHPAEPQTVPYADAPPSIGLSVPGSLGPVGTLPITTPALPPPPKAESHPATQSAPIRVMSSVQMAKLIRKVMPIYPTLARSVRVSGVVHLIGTIGKDGTIHDLRLVDGHPLLTQAAMDAVAQWVYAPTLLNGQPVEVIAPIEVNFTLGQ
jgi:periplasmic protein TonB